MAGSESASGTAKFHNEMGVETISIGAREFECIGAKPPLDHPHIYLDMGTGNEVICPYCSTLYRLDENLGPHDAVPAEAVLK